MIKFNMVVVCLLSTLVLSAQQKVNKTGLTGKWMVAAMQYDGAYHNFDTDSTGYNEAAKKQMKNPKDSAKAAMKFEMFFEMVKGASFVFDASGMYLEMDGHKNVQRGKYTLDEVKGIINTQVAKRIGQLQVWMSNGILCLRDLKNPKQITYYCRKAN